MLLIMNIYKGISGAVRRRILKKLSKAKSLTVNSIVSEFDLSRPAISRHLRVLHESGLIKMKRMGRERHCRINPRALEKMSAWINTTLKSK